MAITELHVQSALQLCVDPNTGKDFISSKSAKNIQIQDNHISLTSFLATPLKAYLMTSKHWWPMH